MSKPMLSAALLKLVIASLFLSTGIVKLSGQERDPLPAFSIGSGYLEAGCKHSGAVFQMEYKVGKYVWHHFRPQIVLTLPQYCAFFFGLGIGWEYYVTDKIIFTPSFTPGFYCKGRSRNLGFPFEFRSAIDISYKWDDRGTVGFQVSHISNASLSHKNPGFNAYLLCFTFPIE